MEPLPDSHDQRLNSHFTAVIPAAGEFLYEFCQYPRRFSLNEATKNIRWMILFSGDVQAVGFRYTSYLFARRIGLTGWVKNLDDGRVQMEVQGELNKVLNLLTHLQNTSPIHIEDCHIKEIPLRGDESEFVITG